MAELEPGLAQEIVEKLMPLVDHNVNVINGRGIIIGSGNKRRIGTLHEGAFEAISQRRAVEFDDASAARLNGVEAGVNLPLHAAGSIIGVIGITGSPDLVRRYAELTKLTAEMLVEQSKLLKAPASHARYREELVLQLVKSESISPELDLWARRLGIDLKSPRVAAVVSVESETRNVDAMVAEMQDIRDALDYPARGNLVAITGLNELVVLKPVEGGVWRPAQYREKVERLRDRLDRGLGTNLVVRIALGHFFPDPDGIARSYQAARETLRVGRSRDPAARTFYYEDVTLPVLLSGFDGTWQAGELHRLLDRLSARDKQGTLRQTLVRWFACDMSLSEAALALGIHRNTMLYRLARIGEITGLDLDRLDSRFLLYAALQTEQRTH